MFAKGPQPGYSPKTEVLKSHPEARCEHQFRGYIEFYAVVLPNGGWIGTGLSAVVAWQSALERIERKKLRDNQQ